MSSQTSFKAAQKVMTKIQQQKEQSRGADQQSLTFETQKLKDVVDSMNTSGITNGESFASPSRIAMNIDSKIDQEEETKMAPKLSHHQQQQQQECQQNSKQLNPPEDEQDDDDDIQNVEDDYETSSQEFTPKDSKDFYNIESKGKNNNSNNNNKEQEKNQVIGSTRKFSQLDEQNQFYFSQYSKLYYANIILTKKLQVTINEKNILKTKLNKLESTKRRHEEQIGFPFDVSTEKKKQRHRRPAVQISRHYLCPSANCPKSYGSEGSLNQHLKLKHPELSKTISSKHQSENASLLNE